MTTTGGWRIESWSREHSRGTIRAEHVGSPALDAAVADVDDFVLGERVHVELEAIPGSYRVKRIWPDVPRFRDPSPKPRVADANPGTQVGDP